MAQAVEELVQGDQPHEAAYQEGDRRNWPRQVESHRGQRDDEVPPEGDAAGEQDAQGDGIQLEEVGAGLAEESPAAQLRPGFRVFRRWAKAKPHGKSPPERTPGTTAPTTASTASLSARCPQAPPLLRAGHFTAG